MIDAGSNSRLNVYEECPHQAFLRFVKKIDLSATSATNRGGDVHKQIENYIKGKTDHLYLKLHEQHRFAVTNFRRQYREFPAAFHLEQRWGFDASMRNTEWKTAWWRVILDLVQLQGEMAWICDWKTGQIYWAKHYDQGMQQICAVFDMFPGVTTSYMWFSYLDLGKDSAPLIVSREEADEYRNKIIGRNLTMTLDKKLDPKPGWHCGRCKYYNHCEWGWETDRDRTIPEP